MRTVNIQPGYQGTEGILVAAASEVVFHHQLHIPLHVGSVEYLTRLFERLDVRFTNYSLVEELYKFYKRRIDHKKGRFPWPGNFIKPWRYKQYEPFIATGDEYVSEYVSQEPVKFDQEYRVYVIGFEIVGMARYDDGDSADLDELEVRRFCTDVIQTWADAGTKPAAFCIDVGRIEDRGLAIVEITDAWACGLYKGVCPKAYTRMLQVRWDELMKQAGLH